MVFVGMGVTGLIFFQLRLTLILVLEAAVVVVENSQTFSFSTVTDLATR